jgi:mRNA interferase RelE/StbE
MSYELAFKTQALAEWQALDNSVRIPLKKKLLERLNNPRMPAAKLSGHPDRYKIKLKHLGYRLVYEVQDLQLIVLVIAIGKREDNWVYRQAEKR